MAALLAHAMNTYQYESIGTDAHRLFLFIADIHDL
jgi:hypothetical protein